MAYIIFLIFVILLLELSRRIKARLASRKAIRLRLAAL